jgi:hypothetical protein
MEGKHFDQLARAVATSGSRRRVLAGLVAGALGSVRIRTTAADDDGIVIADASGGDNNLATVVDPATSGNNRDRDRDEAEKDDDEEKDKDHDGERNRDGCNPEACPPDESTNSTGSGFCCDDGFCSCGGACCGGPDCWIITTEVSGQDGPTVRESCSRPPNGCLQCSDSGGQCCADCTANDECISPCLECEGEPSEGVCCAKCFDPDTRCQQIPDTTPISGGRIRRR